jgi:hypothetical protein
MTIPISRLTVTTVSGYDPNALNSRKRTAMAVTTWTITPPMVFLLNTLDWPRATPTIMPMIQPAEKSQTMIVAIHHHISITSFSLAVVTKGSLHFNIFIQPAPRSPRGRRRAPGRPRP